MPPPKSGNENEICYRPAESRAARASRPDWLGFLLFTVALSSLVYGLIESSGVRLMVISGGILVTSTVAGRLTSRVPVRLLIGPGLIIIGAGLLLMRGLDAS